MFFATKLWITSARLILNFCAENFFQRKVFLILNNFST